MRLVAEQRRGRRRVVWVAALFHELAAWAEPGRGGAAPRPVRLDSGEGLAASLLVAFGQAFDVVHAVAGFPVECAVAEEVRVAFGARADKEGNNADAIF